MRYNDGSCVRAALVNAIGCLVGRDAASIAMEIQKEDDTHYKTLKPLCHVVHRIKHINFVKPTKGMLGDGSSDKFGKAFDHLGNLTKAVWIVPLCQAGVVDHCITIDANGGRILDSFETCAIFLSIFSLMLCGGDKMNKLHVAEVRQVVHNHQ